MSKIITSPPTGLVVSAKLGGIPVSTSSVSNAGYFRIGNVVLTIPPEQIQCHKVINSDEVMPLRFPFAMPIKTGQSRWDVTWSWKALADFDTQDYTQWKIIQKLLAMFKAAPFVEVENEHIRQIVNPGTLTLGATNDDVMAFALRQMRVDTVPDIRDALQVTMTMSLFNFRPYSKNFQYNTDTHVPASSAATSNAFDSYLNTWISNNIEHDPTQQPVGSIVSTSDWEEQSPGVVTLSCREYLACKLPYVSPTPQGLSNPVLPNPGAHSSSLNTSGFVDNVFISPIVPSNPQVGWWVQAVKAGESAGAGNYNAINFTTVTNAGAPSAAVGILQWVRGSAIDAMKGCDTCVGTRYISTAIQNGFLIPSSNASSGYTWNGNLSVSNPKSADTSLATYISWMQSPPISGGASQLQDDMAIGWAIQKLQANSGSVLRAWEAQYFGQGNVNKGQSDPTTQNTYFTKLANSWRSNSGNPTAFTNNSNSIPTPQPIAPPVGPTVTSGTTSTTGVLPITPQIEYYIGQNWTYEYATETTGFLYKVHDITMTSSDPIFGTQPSSSDIPNIDPQHFIYPNQISVVFVNNIAQLPLSSYQYPTYQHLGPVSTQVSIGMLSDAYIPPDVDTYAEPNHVGLSFLSTITTLLEDQFQRLRNEWRYVSSIQSMQAVSVKNQVLNMLGIRGLLTKEITTETIPDAANLVSAQYNAIQYENVFEEITDGANPFFTSTVPAQFASLWYTIMRDGSLDTYSNDQSLLVLTNLSSLMRDPNGPTSQALLYNWLVGSDPQPPPTAAYTIPVPKGFAFTGAEQTLILEILGESGGEGGVFNTSLNTIATGANIIVNSLFSPSTLNSSFQALQSAKAFITQHPDIASRIQSHNPLNFSDYFIVKNWVTLNPSLPDYSKFQTASTAIENRLQQALNAISPVPESPINTLFDAYFATAYSSNFKNIQAQISKAMTIKAIRDRFNTPNSTATPGEPGGGNDSHGCYRDLGIYQLELGGLDYNPAIYFHDDNADLNNQLQSQITQIVDTTVQRAENFAYTTPVANKAALMQSTTASFAPTVEAILSNVETSSYTMARAFPTFKLFLMEDNSQKPFFSFDKFYSYATVLDMEVIRYRDKPDTAVIQISNLMHLLDQHLYDTTPQGSQERRLNKDIEVPIPSGSGGALTGGSGVGGHVINVEAVNIDNRFPQINATPGDQKFPLSYFALQTGTKIQIRMGFSNSPDKLTPVFTGLVTEIQGDEILTITAQSYMLELVSPVTDGIRHDGFAVDSFLNSIPNTIAKATRDISNGYFLSALGEPIKLVNGSSAAYGGWGTVGGATPIVTPGGGAQDVISAMLHVSTAKHFGYWQWDATPDKLMKGVSWHTAIASVLTSLSSSPLTSGASGLESGFDRSFENILTTHVFGPDGKVGVDTNGSSRGWLYEKPGGFGSPEYFVPKDPNLTPWTLIQDIARRFPEFILAVKQYGFPYTADATLVFANPHDFYSARATVPSDISTQQDASNNDKLFNTWWSNGSSSGQQQFIAFCNTFGSQWLYDTLNAYQDSVNAPRGFIYKPGVTNSKSDGSINTLVSYITSASIFFKVVDIYNEQIGSLSSSILNFAGGNVVGMGVSRVAVQQNLSQVVQNYYNFYNQKSTSSTGNYSGSRMKPVRRYHLVNGDNIVHNGIMLNEKFYNAVTLDGLTLMANAAIAPNHQRLLNADSYIVSPDNVHNWPQAKNSYIQTFLRDEMAKMYRGELVLLGNPEIEPFDIITLMDPSMGISGPLEVDSVIHSFNQENGYITIVRPRAFVIINDKLAMSTWAATGEMLNNVSDMIDGYASKAFGMDPTATSTTEAIAVTAAVAGGIAAGPWVAAAAVITGTAFVFWMGEEYKGINPIGIAPLMRFERPWVGGIEGFQISDLKQLIGIKWQYFKEDEIEPTLYSYRAAKKMGLIPSFLN